MAPVHGKNTDVYANGYVLSPFLNTASFAGTRDNAETTTFKQNSKTYIPGLKDGTWSLDGIWDGVVSAVDDILFQAFGAGGATILSYMPQGDAFGNLVFTADAIDVAHNVNSAIAGAATIAASLSMGPTGLVDRGLMLHSMQAEAAGGNSGNVNNGASSANGAALTIHVTAATTLAVNIQDSADGTTFADIAGTTLSVATGRSSQRVQVSGTIRQYVRVKWTGTGTFAAIVSRF